MEEVIKNDQEVREIFAGTALQLKSMVGVKLEFGSFVSEIQQSGDVLISNVVSGWSMTIPSLTSVWSVVTGWMIRWDDSAIKSLNSYISMLVYPTVMLMPAGDDEYFEAIVSAHEKLNERIGYSEDNYDENNFAVDIAARKIFSELIKEQEDE